MPSLDKVSLRLLAGATSGTTDLLEPAWLEQHWARLIASPEHAFERALDPLGWSVYTTAIVRQSKNDYGDQWAERTRLRRVRTQLLGSASAPTARLAAAMGRRGPAQRARICYERIIPDHLDTDRFVRRELRRQMARTDRRARGGTGMNRVSRMALRLSKKWPSGSVLSCRFLDGEKGWKRDVEKAAHEWENHANVKFRFGAKVDAEIRISFFADDGSWSALGRDALNAGYFRPGEATMNFGWIPEDPGAIEVRRVVLHEFGHALGCVHEQESPRFTRKWNREAVFAYFSGPPNRWPREDIIANVLHKYGPKGIKATEYDPKSIMLYDFDASMFTDGGGPTNQNDKLSAKDKAMIRRLYPKGRDPQ